MKLSSKYNRIEILQTNIHFPLPYIYLYSDFYCCSLYFHVDSSYCLGSFQFILKDSINYVLYGMSVTNKLFLFLLV